MSDQRAGMLDAESLHKWTFEELEELFYDAFLRDARSENYTAGQMRSNARIAALAVEKRNGWRPF